MSVLSPTEGYAAFLRYADHKTETPLGRLLVQGMMAGLWVAVYAHACIAFAGYFYHPTQPATATYSRLVYGALFPGAFIPVALTGTELFTGNTAAMTVLLLNTLSVPKKHRTTQLGPAQQKIYKILRVCELSLLGNLIGAVLGSALLSYASSTFSLSQGTSPSPASYLMKMAQSKVSLNWSGALVLGIGCNMLVCLATWCTLIIKDGAGKILAMWFSVGTFALGGFEHIVVNFYILSLYWMTADVSVGSGAFHLLGRIIFHNWVPVCIGNVIGGCIFTGTVWWYTLSPLPTRHIRLEETPEYLDQEEMPLNPHKNHSPNDEYDEEAAGDLLNDNDVWYHDARDRA